MFYVEKTIEVSAAHYLDVPGKHPEGNNHGHNFVITVYCRAEKLNYYGQVVDFKTIEDIVRKKMEHKMQNDVFSFNPTAENIAAWVLGQVPCCYKVRVKETENNIAIVEDIK